MLNFVSFILQLFCQKSRTNAANYFAITNSATSNSMQVHTIVSVECLVNKGLVVTGCGHMRSATTVDYSSSALYDYKGCSYTTK